MQVLECETSHEPITEHKMTKSTKENSAMFYLSGRVLKGDLVNKLESKACATLTLSRSSIWCKLIGYQIVLKSAPFLYLFSLNLKYLCKLKIKKLKNRANNTN